MSAFPAGRWAGRWIWAADAPAGAVRTVVAMRATLHADGGDLPARVHALAGYVLWVNGEELARGPARANPRRHVYDVVDLPLRPGDNEIAVLAWCYGQAMPWWSPPPGRGDLVAGAFVLDALGFGTGPDWRARALPGWGMSVPEGVLGRGRELLDARALPHGWQTAPAGDWPAAIVRRPYAPGEPDVASPPSYPVGPVGPRLTSWPAARTVALRRQGSAWVSDEGVLAGTVRVELSGAAGAGGLVQVAERLDHEGMPRPTEDDAAFEVVTAGTRTVLETLDRYGLAALTVSGLDVHAVEVVERLHPVQGDAEFRCSDPRLERIWQAGRRTVSLCSHDAYVDCPTREQRAWVGDAVVHQLVDLASNADWTLARWYPRMAASPRADGMLPMVVGGDAESMDRMIIPDWALHWVHAVWNLYRYLGDHDEIAALLPVAEGVLRWFEPFCDAAGLPTDVPGGVLIDWAAVDTEGVSAALCGLWGRGLLELAEMSEWLGDWGRAGWARRRHALLRKGFEQLWDPRLRRYSDVRDGRTASQHGQAAAIVGGLVPEDRIARLVELLTDGDRLVHAAFAMADAPALPNSELDTSGYLAGRRPDPWWDVDTELVRAQPFFRYVVHDALVTAGRADLVASQCLDWDVLLDRAPETLGETWYGGTTCHGWSSTPTRDLMTATLGVRPAEPGFRSAVVEPALGGLAWASGTVPTPHGPIRVSVEPGVLAVSSPVPFGHAGVTHAAGDHTLPI